MLHHTVAHIADVILWTIGLTVIAVLLAVYFLLSPGDPVEGNWLKRYRGD